MKPMSDLRKADIERTIRARIGTERPIHPFVGVGIALILDYLVRHEKMDVLTNGQPIRQSGGLVTGANYVMAIFRGPDRLGYAEGQDFYEVLTISVAQALGILKGGKSDGICTECN